MTTSFACAVVVSYQSADTIAATLAAVVDQVGSVCVVDNGSDEATTTILLQLTHALDDLVTVQWNRENLGLASALNQGIRWAIGNGFRYVLTLDQDSVAAPRMVETLIQALETDSSIGLAAPRSIEDCNGRLYSLGVSESQSDREVHFVELVHASGNLIPVSVFETTGLFREDLFIDQVDYEFCLRLRKMGFRIAVVDRATMRHRLGSITTTRVGGKVLHCANHAYQRHYYLARNRLVVSYLHRDLSYMRSQADSMAREVCKIVLCEQGKIVKLRAVASASSMA